MVYIIILNYNNWKDTIECLESVLKLNYNTFKVILVDNNSPNNSLKYIHNWANGFDHQQIEPHPELSDLVYPLLSKPVAYDHITKEGALAANNIKTTLPLLTTIQTGENRGFAAGNNVGIRYALKQNDCEFVWLLNNDTLVKKDALSQLVNYHRASAVKYGIVGSKLMYYQRPDTIQAIAGRYNKWLCTTHHIGGNEVDKGQFDYPHTPNADYIVGASMFVCRDFIEDVGLMNEDYFLYFEELDWSHRGKLRGWDMAVCTASIVYHKEGSSINANESKSVLADYYSLRNRLLFTKRFAPVALPFIYLSFLGVAINRIRRGQFSRLGMILRVIFKK